MKKIKAAVVTVAAMAGLAVSITPAQAADICTAGGNGKYICKYGVTKHDLPNGEDEQYFVGTDYAVWTRWTTNGSWSRWTSMGKPDPYGKASAASPIKVTDTQTSNQFRTTVHLTNSNGAFVGKTRYDIGLDWQNWDFPNCC
ncbi:hypothetical protein [Streptomyces sp. V2I9]|uniref:hypothetical protein n=1 Tax=Streptomyces sp. V2I9 TaxID=3042304 RepID=UPI0027D79FD2|nr:hypothetical protein [Streptomyces sp. V2I9]